MALLPFSSSGQNSPRINEWFPIANGTKSLWAFSKKQITRLSHKPEYGSDEYKTWVKQDDFIRFLQGEVSSPARCCLFTHRFHYYTFIYGCSCPKAARYALQISTISITGTAIPPLLGESQSVYGKRRKVVDYCHLWTTLALRHSTMVNRLYFPEKFDGLPRAAFIHRSLKK